MRLRILLTGAHLLLIAAVPPVRGDFVPEGDEAAGKAFDELMPTLVERAYLEARGDLD